MFLPLEFKIINAGDFLLLPEDELLELLHDFKPWLCGLSEPLKKSLLTIDTLFETYIDSSEMVSGIWSLPVLAMI